MKKRIRLLSIVISLLIFAAVFEVIAYKYQVAASDVNVDNLSEDEYVEIITKLGYVPGSFVIRTKEALDQQLLYRKIKESDSFKLLGETRQNDVQLRNVSKKNNIVGYQDSRLRHQVLSDYLKDQKNTKSNKDQLKDNNYQVLAGKLDPITAGYLSQLKSQPFIENAEVELVFKSGIFPLPRNTTVSPRLLYSPLSWDRYIDNDQDGQWDSGAWGQDYSNMWGLEQLGADQVWNQYDGSGQVIAIIDSGLDCQHEDIKDNLYINQAEDRNGNGQYEPWHYEDIRNGLGGDIDYIDQDGNGVVDDVAGAAFISTWSNSLGQYIPAEPRGDIVDEYGHGTHLAGTIAATRNNKYGIAGVASGSKILTIKAFTKTTLFLSDFIRSLDYLSSFDIDIINLSWGGSYTDFFDYYFSILNDSKINIVVSAGNSSTYAELFSPCSNKYVTCVGAGTTDKQLADFSNYGLPLDLVAPGGNDSSGDEKNINILSLLSSDYEVDKGSQDRIVGDKYLLSRGTSMAAPHVAGLAAILRQYRGTKEDASETEQALKLLSRQSDDQFRSDFKTGYGWPDLNLLDQLPEEIVAFSIDSPQPYSLVGDQLELHLQASGKDYLFNSKKLNFSWKSVNDDSLQPQQLSFKQIGSNLFDLNLAGTANGKIIIQADYVENGWVIGSDAIVLIRQDKQSKILWDESELLLKEDVDPSFYQIEPMVLDVDGDNLNETIAVLNHFDITDYIGGWAVGLYNSRLAVFDNNDQIVNPWPVSLGAGRGIRNLYGWTVGDMNGDSRDDIVGISWDGSWPSKVVGIGSDGQPLAENEVLYDPRIINDHMNTIHRPSMIDWDSDGKKEVLVVRHDVYSTSDHWFDFVNDKAEIEKTVELEYVVLGQPGVADTDGDGVDEVWYIGRKYIGNKGNIYGLIKYDPATDLLAVVYDDLKPIGSFQDDSPYLQPPVFIKDPGGQDFLLIDFLRRYYLISSNGELVDGWPVEVLDDEDLSCGNCWYSSRHSFVKFSGKTYIIIASSVDGLWDDSDFSQLKLFDLFGKQLFDFRIDNQETYSYIWFDENSLSSLYFPQKDASLMLIQDLRYHQGGDSLYALPFPSNADLDLEDYGWVREEINGVGFYKTDISACGFGSLVGYLEKSNDKPFFTYACSDYYWGLKYGGKTMLGKSPLPVGDQSVEIIWHGFEGNGRRDNSIEIDQPILIIKEDAPVVE